MKIHEIINQIKREHWTKEIKLPQNLRIIGTSIKVLKNKKDKYLTGIIYLSPAHESIKYGGFHTCPKASNGCALACLGKNSRRLKMERGFNSKLWKTLLLKYRPDLFKLLLFRDLRNLIKRAKKQKLKPACRLNGCSDLLWEIKMPEIFEEFPTIQFYDYTKIKSRLKCVPSNYHLTFSRSENNEKECIEVLKEGFNVAVVFKDLQKAINMGWNGYPVFDADITDFRPKDKFGIAGLSVKARVKDKTGFIIYN